ncbi:MAG: DUF2933 domain-containing protein [bacterium]|nr:DUF2933 domain-containing protein [bacterium]
MNKQIKLITVLSFGIIAFLLIYEHRVHIFGNATYVLFAVFIGLHLLMHLGHGGHGNHGEQKKKGEHNHE